MEKTIKNIGELVLYKNNQLIAFNKPAGISIQSDKTGDKPFIDLAEIYTNQKLGLIHRIDRPVSGVTVFAKKDKAAAALSEQFRNSTIEKIYWAVTANRPENDEGVLTHFLKKNGRINKSFVCEENDPDGQKAELQYKYLASSDRYHLLEISLLTGRHHQIRAQLAAIGCPVKGDVKYGARRGNKDRSIQLHARSISFTHPVSGEREYVEAPTPDLSIWKAFNI